MVETTVDAERAAPAPAPTRMRWVRPLIAGATGSSRSRLRGEGVLDTVEHEWGTTTYPGGVTYRTVRLTFTVHVPGREPYSASTVQRLRHDAIERFTPGMTFDLVIDAADHDRVGVDFTAL
jgi:hypothetical protein